MAHNPGRPVDSDALLDMDGNSPGWIELYNNSPLPVVLTGWALSDDPWVPGKWVFAAPVSPAITHTTVPGNGYRVVFCGGLARNIANVEAHADFSLDDSGVVLLSQPDGSGGWTVVSQIGTAALPYPSQRKGVSFGYPGNDNTKTPVYFESDTPGASNGPSGVDAFCVQCSAGVHGFPVLAFDYHDHARCNHRLHHQWRPSDFHAWHAGGRRRC